MHPFIFPCVFIYLFIYYVSPPEVGETSYFSAGGVRRRPTFLVRCIASTIVDQIASNFVGMSLWGVSRLHQILVTLTSFPRSPGHICHFSMRHIVCDFPSKLPAQFAANLGSRFLLLTSKEQYMSVTLTSVSRSPPVIDTRFLVRNLAPTILVQIASNFVGTSLWGVQGRQVTFVIFPCATLYATSRPNYLHNLLQIWVQGFCCSPLKNNICQ